MDIEDKWWEHFDTTPVDAHLIKTKSRENTLRFFMFARFICALLGFCARKFSAKFEKNGTFSLTEGYRPCSLHHSEKFHQRCSNSWMLHR